MKKALSLYFLLFSFLIQPIGVFPQKLRTLSRESKETFASNAAVSSKTPLRSPFGNLESIDAEGGVLIQWQMKTETSVLGYYVHRIDSNGDQIVNSQVVFSSAAMLADLTLYGEQYAFLDRFGSGSAAYYIEGIDMNGRSFQSNITTPIVAERFPIDISHVPSNEEVQGRIESQSLKSTELQIPKEVEVNINRFTEAADNEGQKYVASRQGARIDVKEEGIYRVTFAQLQSAGFDINAPKANWQLYLNGSEQAITVNENAEYVEFYGKGVDTVESDIQGYFLVVGETGGRRIQNLVARPSTSTVIQPSYNQTFQLKERVFYVNTILNGAAENYWGNPIGSSGLNILFDLSGIDFNVPVSTIQIKVQGFSAGLHTVRTTLNGQVLDSLSGVAQFPMSLSIQIPTSLLKDASLNQGANTLNLASVGPSGDFNLFDSISISFARKPLALNKTLKAYALNNKKSTLTGFTSANVRVFDVSNESDVREMTNLPFTDQGGNFGAVLPAARGKVYYAVEDSAIKSPFAVVNNDGEVLGDPGIGAELIIISYKDFLAEAQEWADYRTAQGVTTKVVNVDEIYNEFGQGVLSSNSIEAFLNYAAHNWNPAPSHVLLIGDASFDSRNYQGDGYFNHVPARMVTTVFEETASDEALADFNNDGLAELAIGRIPARSVINRNLANEAVFPASDQIQINSHGFAIGTKISLSTTGVMPGDLSTATPYYAIVVDANNIKLASSLENAQAGTPVDITAATGSGTHTLTAYPFMVATALAKVKKWESSLPEDPLSRGFICASHWDTATPGDPNDPETLFQEMCRRLRDELPAGTPTLLMNSATSTKVEILAAMNNVDINNVSQGRFIVNYSGHGNLINWWSDVFYGASSVPSLTNHNAEGIYTMLTCLNGQFDNLRGVSLSEHLLNWNNGGAVAAWSSSGRTTPDVQEVMARRFYNQLGKGNITRLGDLIKDAKSVLVGGADVRLSWALLGDPMLKVR